MRLLRRIGVDKKLLGCLIVYRILMVLSSQQSVDVFCTLDLEGSNKNANFNLCYELKVSTDKRKDVEAKTLLLVASSNFDIGG